MGSCKYAALACCLLLAGCGAGVKSGKVAVLLQPDQYERLAEKISDGHKYLQNRKVAVLPFSYTDRHASDDGVVVSERLLTRIINRRELEVIERGLLEKVLSELKLQRSGAIDESSIKGLGKILGVEALVTGTLTRRRDGRIEINARLIKTESAAVITAAAEIVSPDWEAAAPPAPRTVYLPAPAPAPAPQPVVSAPFAPLAGRERANCPRGLLYYWNFDSATPTGTRDVYSGLEAALKGAALSPGKVNYALDLKNSDYLKVSDRPELAPRKSVTVEAWVNLRGINYYESGSRIFCEAGAYCFVIGGAESSTANLVAFMPGVSGPRGHISRAELQPGSWYHTAFTYDGSVVTIYLNGKIDSTFPASGRLGRGDRGAFVGWDPNAVTGYHSPVNGLVDELAIYNRALTPAEIASHYDKGQRGKGYCSL